MPLVLLLVILSFVTASGRAAELGRTLLDGTHLLRSGNSPEWDELAGAVPYGFRLDVRFSAEANDQEMTLFIRQDQVKLDWGVELNGKKIGKLFAMEAPLIHTLAIPAKGLRAGENVLSIVPPKDGDDIFVGPISMDTRPPAEAVSQATLAIEVSDADSHSHLPCRITIVDAKGAYTCLNPASGQKLAARPGVIYTPDGKARCGLLPGIYTVYASRGFEYGIAKETVTIGVGDSRNVALAIRREVPTPGLVCSDTHIHTFTYSHHGDATVEERVVTLAGEGIELPIATDHEYLADYSAPAEAMGVEPYFTPVIGCETTTKKGHFNSFPIVSGSRVPDAHIEDWPMLVKSIRATPGVRVVILNHPRNIHNEFQPFAATHFNAVTGENRRGFEFDFDAVELVNSSALQSDWMINFRDWFALLNYGYRVTGVGSSDVHDVSRYIVSQGRSYVFCNDTDPAHIDINAACESFLKGKVLVGMGLLADMTVNGTYRVGDIATDLGDTLNVEIKVLGPSWVTADHLELFANGIKIREANLDSQKRKDGILSQVQWTIPRPKHDVHLVAIASGPGVTAPYWPIPRPYQPSSKTWMPRVIGATNPIWIDADGDHHFTPARRYAEKLVQDSGASPQRLIKNLAPYDAMVAAQAASLCQKAGMDLRSAEFTKAVESGSEATREGIRAYLETER